MRHAVVAALCGAGWDGDAAKIPAVPAVSAVVDLARAAADSTGTPRASITGSQTGRGGATDNPRPAAHCAGSARSAGAVPEKLIAVNVVIRPAGAAGGFHDERSARRAHAYFGESSDLAVRLRGDRESSGAPGAAGTDDHRIGDASARGDGYRDCRLTVAAATSPASALATAFLIDRPAPAATATASPPCLDCDRNQLASGTG